MRSWTSATITAILLIALGILPRDSAEVYQAEAGRLLRQLYSGESKPLARFTGATLGNEFLIKAKPRLHLLLDQQAADPPAKRRARALLLALDGQWEEARAIFRNLVLEFPMDSALRNDLGVAELGTASSDPMAWFRSLEEFKLASTSKSYFAEPIFNSILVYRRLGLTQLEVAAMRKYRSIEPQSAWESVLNELSSGDSTAPLAAMPPEERARFLRNRPGDARTSVMEYALQPTNPIPKNYLWVGEELSRLQQDETVRLALMPLLSGDFEAVVTTRRLVESGREFYFRDRLKESHDAYKKARVRLGQIDSVFDQLWIDLNDADALIRAGQFAQAAPLLHRVLAESETRDLRWIRARALSAFGAQPILAGTLYETILRLEEALELYRSIGERQESARALNYVATYFNLAGSREEGLRFTLDALAVASPSDHIRRTQLHMLVAETLSRMGYFDFAEPFGEQAIYHAEKTGNPGSVANTRMHLAGINLSTNRIDEAAANIDAAYKTIPQIAAELSRKSREVETNLVQARVLLKRNQFSAAQETLQRNVRLIEAHPEYLQMHMYSQSRLLLAEALAGQGRFDDADREFQKAVQSVEDDQRYLSILELQIAFDQERRNLYESAVRFEYRNRGCEQAWNLIQGYKAKLFMDVLGRFTPAVRRLSLSRLSVSDVRKRLLGGGQILEYAVLPDQLLAWVLSPRGFECRAIPVSANELNLAITSALNQVQRRDSAEELLYRLYDILVEPLADLLEDNHTLIVVPDSILHRVPFASLKSRKTKQYLIEKAPMLESPSVSYLFSETQSNASGMPVAFGSRTYDTFTHKELKAVLDIEPSVRIHNGPEVTKDTFLKALPASSLVYYAGHSALDVREPLRAAILLDGNKQGPNTVAALEIIEQRMQRNSTVILSSCETSIGSSTDGPGIRGLTSAFLVAGAGSVVGSLWPVESTSTTQLMPFLFRSFLGEKQSIIQSLREAQLKMLRDPQFSHPYYWSGFVVTGNLSAARAAVRR